MYQVIQLNIIKKKEKKQNSSFRCEGYIYFVSANIGLSSDMKWLCCVRLVVILKRNESLAKKVAARGLFLY